MVYRYRQRKSNKVLYIILIIVALVAVPILIFHYVSTKTDIEIPNILALAELSTNGYMKVGVDAAAIENMGVITLTSECYQLTANTEISQALSIFNGLAKKIDLRPNTHDLMKDTFDNLEIEVLMVKIVELRDNIFIGNLILKQGNKILSLDSRPSDGIALAVRTDAPIYIKEDLMKSEGRYVC